MTGSIHRPHEALRRAIAWLAAQPAGERRRRIEEAALRFDLSPEDEEFLRREFGGNPDESDTNETGN